MLYRLSALNVIEQNQSAAPHTLFVSTPPRLSLGTNFLIVFDTTPELPIEGFPPDSTGRGGNHNMRSAAVPVHRSDCRHPVSGRVLFDRVVRRGGGEVIVGVGRAD